MSIRHPTSRVDLVNGDETSEVETMCSVLRAAGGLAVMRCDGMGCGATYVARKEYSIEVGI